MRNLGTFTQLSGNAEWQNYVADLIAHEIKYTLSLKNEFYLSISGGTTPIVIFQKLITDNCLTHDQWEKVSVFWMDERIVPKNSSDSNFENAMKILQDLPCRFYPMYNPSCEIEENLQNYRQELEKISQKSAIPQFDLILLGMGEDGHTASLFPNSKGLDENEKWVVYNHVSNPLADRITLTFPLINNAKKRFVLLNGEKKISILQEAVKAKTNYPIEELFNSKYELNWIYY